MTLVVPQTAGTTFIPVTLPIGTNRPNVYLAFGDSITDGEGSSDGNGYASRLLRKLQAHYGRATVIKDGLGATRSNRGSDRLPDSLTVRPAYTLIHYGTNDWNDGRVQVQPAVLHHRQPAPHGAGREGPAGPARARRPSSPAIPSTSRRSRRGTSGWRRWTCASGTWRGRRGRCWWIWRPAFLRAPSLPALFADHVHPSDAGYEVMAQAFFEAIVRPPAAGTDFGGPVLFKSHF